MWMNYEGRFCGGRRNVVALWFKSGEGLRFWLLAFVMARDLTVKGCACTHELLA